MRHTITTETQGDDKVQMNEKAQRDDKMSRSIGVPAQDDAQGGVLSKESFEILLNRTVITSIDFIEFSNTLYEYHVFHGKDWKNNTLGLYLKALVQYLNNDTVHSNSLSPTWQTFADILKEAIELQTSNGENTISELYDPQVREKYQDRDKYSSKLHFDSLLHREILTFESFRDFVNTLYMYFLCHGTTWENPTLASFLEVLAIYSQSVSQVYKNHNKKEDPSISTWTIFGIILDAPTIYE